ncbi:hypothetical protein EUGRSUZ_L00480 [Eucalyptus grandis]|uniref:non-specific serine/threonine protein kinase n=1 Tax=Eucalyptus grandis TaxID=71139 RepID=A0A058ZVB8_EUCGR|nr:hypothetical protein EUGRSUZ_L00480 [Eucalyptus grandis]
MLYAWIRLKSSPPTERPGNSGIGKTQLIMNKSSALTLVEAGGNETDLLALLEFKAQITNSDGVLSSWNDSSHFCKWYGVTCSHRHQRVLVLDLHSKNLIGVLPPHIGNLSFLREVYLQNNSFHAEIPPHFGRLLRLQKLFLNNNSFSGFNMLKGNLPTELCSLSKLQGLILQFNSLMGNIPPSIGNLSSLHKFGIELNNFDGTIPETLGQLRNLRRLGLTVNKFVGTIPISIFNISALAHLNVGENQLEGGLPNDLGFTLPNIEWISTFRNHLTGPIPESISNASNLEAIQININNFTGKVPSFSKIRGLNRNLINLEALEMLGNNISGNIPLEIGNLNNLKYLNLGQNELSGQIPESFGNLRMLIELYLNSNNFRGSIPSSLKNCQNLLLLDLSTNNLSGYIPPEIMCLSSLSIYLDLSRNSLTGSLPEEVGKLQNLGELRLNENRLSQQIPSSIGSCISMERLYVQDNFFEGPLPSTMSSMRGLQVLNVSNNQLFGQIPKFLEISGIAKILISIVSALVGVACILSLLYFFWFRHNKKASTSSSSEDGFLHVSYNSLLKATGGFSSTNLLGVGNFGSVYRGLLDQTQLIVAVKILDLTCHGASNSFIAECEVLRRIRHRNLVKVLTVCSGFDFNGNDFKALVYEFMPNGSLDEWLHPIASQYIERSKLSLLERVNISIDVACALDYLHHHYEMPIVHCDLKPSNILLDDEKTGHLGDFGLARFLPEAMHKLLANQSSSVKVKGSFGYIAPEYGMGSVVSTQGDVYSFGVLILEMFIGKRPTDDMFENGLDLHHFAKATLTDRVEKAIDPVLLQEIEELNKTQRVTLEGKNKSWSNIQDCLASIIKIGVACSSKSPRERMDIGDTLTKLQGIKKNFLISLSLPS